MKTVSFFSLMLLSTAMHAQQSNELLFDFGDDMHIFKNTTNQIFLITKGDKILYPKLKFVNRVWDNLQVLDKNNVPFFILPTGEKSNEPKLNIGLCGTVGHYTCAIVEGAEKYYITKDETFYDYNNQEPPVRIDSIAKTGIDKLYFSNHQQQIQYNENNLMVVEYKTFPYAVVIEKGNQKGILFNGEVTYVDAILSTDHWVFKIRQKNKIEFYKITPINYASITDFQHHLAKFKLPNGKIGYVDTDGKEYYK